MKGIFLVLSCFMLISAQADSSGGLVLRAHVPLTTKIGWRMINGHMKAHTISNSPSQNLHVQQTTSPDGFTYITVTQP